MRALTLFLFTAVALSAAGQSSSVTLYVIDSVAIIEEPKGDEGELLETDIESINEVTGNGLGDRYGLKYVGKIVFIITKEFARRPDEIRKIPGFRKMEKKDGKWYLKGAGSPYSGPFIDYYYNGKKYREGFLKDGFLHGRRIMYYQDGQKKADSGFSEGQSDGTHEEYFINGKLQQQGVFKAGKEEGLWKEWYSTGVLKKQFEFKGGKPIVDKQTDKINSLFNKGLRSHEEGNYKAAIRYFDKAIEIDSNYSELYFHRSRAYLFDFQFDRALVECSKAIEIEPLYKEAYSNRAFVRIRRFELADSRVLTKNSEVTILAGKKIADMPKAEKDKICEDLKKGFELGDKKDMIKDAMKEYCD